MKEPVTNATQGSHRLCGAFKHSERELLPGLPKLCFPLVELPEVVWIFPPDEFFQDWPRSYSAS